MKHFFILLGLFFSASLAFSQNLVVNPSFEITNSNCANFGGEGFRADLYPSWDNANSNAAGDSCSSPDLFSACNITLPGIGGFTVMPNSILGYQYSRTGTRHAGIITYDVTSSTYREYIQGHTTTPLVAGQTYCVSMYVSLPNAMPFATNNIGVYFSNTHYLRDACTQGAMINVTPQLNYTCGAITDTTANWFRIQWSYVATGGEQYFVIGNFYNNAGTTIVNTGQSPFPNPFAYYYIDDVSIVPNSCCFAEIINPGPLCSSAAPLNLTVTTGLGSSCSPSLTGTWSGPGITNTSTGEFSPSVAGPGVHTVNFTLSCGYVASTQVVVGPCTPLTVCQNGGNLVVSGGIGPYSWQRQTTQQDCSACLPAVPPFIQPCSLPAGCAVNVTVWTTFASGTSIPIPSSFPIRVVDTSGTIFTITNLASVPVCAGCPTITVTPSAQTNVACFGGTNGSATVSASGGAGGYTYTWQPGNLSGATQTALPAGVYTVTATDANSCTGTTTITITQPTSALTLQTSSTAADCGVSNGSATVLVSGGTPSYGYSWLPSGGNTATASNLAAGNYSITVTDANNCTATAQVSVLNTNGPVVTLAGQTNVACNGGNNGSATISISQGTVPYSISWSPSGGTATTASNLSAGTYVASVTDGAGCVATQAVTITEPPVLQAAATSQPASCGFSDGSAQVTVQGGKPPYGYAWSPSGGSTATANNLAGGSYTVTVTDSANCTASATVTVSVVGVDSSLVLTTVTTPESCVGNDGTALVTVTGGTSPYTYLWNGGTSVDSSFTAGLTAGTYTITVTDQCYSKSAQVTIDQTFTIPPKILPNVFTPNGDGVNDIYTVGNQFESTHDFSCVIYNRWGVPVHKSADKAILWKPKNITDGTYFILVTYTDCTGKDEKLTSTITVAGTK